jgi:hypothetical protein
VPQGNSLVLGEISASYPLGSFAEMPSTSNPDAGPAQQQTSKNSVVSRGSSGSGKGSQSGSPTSKMSTGSGSPQWGKHRPGDGAYYHYSADHPQSQRNWERGTKGGKGRSG